MLSPENTESELRHHAASLRSLARDLLRDGHAADDVTQQTMHAALTHRELRSGPLGGWLHRVLENFARQWRRGERRRTARHANLPAPDPEPAVDESLMRRESLRAVTDAVLQLDEPYQTTIFLRYFEDLPPRAICKRTGANLATVKSRLQRGLVMLRQKLDRQRTRDGKDWRRALAATFALPFAAGAAVTVTTTGVLMGTTSKVAIAAAVVCAGSLFAWRLFDDPVPVSSEAHTATTDANVASAAAITRDDRAAESREPAKEAAPLSPWLEHPFEHELEVVRLDPRGIPCEGRTIHLAPRDVAFNQSPTRTGPDGHAVVAWRSRTPTGEVVVKDDHGMLVRVPLQHGRRTTLALGGADSSKGGISFSFKVANGIAMLGEMPVVGRLFQAKTGDEVDGRTMHAGLHPHAVFGDDGGFVPEPPTTIEVQDALGGVLHRYEALSISDITRFSTDRDTFDGEQATAKPETPSIHGAVFGEDGKPAKNTPVALLGSSPQPLQQVATDDDGHFVFENCVEGTFTVRAGGDANGLGTTTAVVTRGRTPARVDLRRDTCIRGRIVRTDHGPATPYRVVWRAEDGTACDETTTADDDTFLFANLPAVPGNVFAWPNSSTNLPVAFAMHVIGDNGELVLRHDNAAQHRITFEPLLPDDCSTAPIDARIWQLDTGLGAEVMRPEPGKPWEIPFLVPGWYRLEVQAPGCGFVDLGRQWLDGKTDVDLGRIELPRPGRVTFVIPEAVVPEKGEHRAFQIVAIRRDLDVRTILDEIPTDRAMFLPAGDYAFAYRHRDGDVRFVRFTARSGEATVVTAQ